MPYPNINRCSSKAGRWSTVLHNLCSYRHCGYLGHEGYLGHWSIVINKQNCIFCWNWNFVYRVCL